VNVEQKGEVPEVAREGDKGNETKWNRFSTTIFDLPLEVLWEIFLYLKTRDIIRAERVCFLFKDIVSSDKKRWMQHYIQISRPRNTISITLKKWKKKMSIREKNPDTNWKALCVEYLKQHKQK